MKKYFFITVKLTKLIFCRKAIQLCPAEIFKQMQEPMYPMKLSHLYSEDKMRKSKNYQKIGSQESLNFFTVNNIKSSIQRIKSIIIKPKHVKEENDKEKGSTNKLFGRKSMRSSFRKIRKVFREKPNDTTDSQTFGNNSNHNLEGKNLSKNKEKVKTERDQEEENELEHKSEISDEENSIKIVKEEKFKRQTFSRKTFRSFKKRSNSSEMTHF